VLVLRLGSANDETQRRHLAVSRARGYARSSARASRRSVLGEQDKGAWSIPKGEYAADEDPLAVAKREFGEELGSQPPEGSYVELGELKQPSRKLITIFAAKGDFDPATLRSNPFELEWPRGSGRMRSFPEVDRAQWFALTEAREKIQAGQAPSIDRLLAQMNKLKGT